MNEDQLISLTCQDCNKSKNCKSTCVFIDKLAGRDKSTREKLPPPDPNNEACIHCDQVQDCNGRCDKTDYTMHLTSVKDTRQAFKKKTILDIRELHDTRLKAISALLYAGFKVKEIPYIVEVLNIQRSRLYGIIKENVK